MTCTDATNTVRPQRLILIQAGVAFIDNFAKFALLGLIANTAAEGRGEMWTSLTAALLIAPFILLAPLAAWLCRRISRERIINGCLIFQAIVCGLLCMAGIAQSLPAALCVFGLLACQSAIFSPAKQSMLKEWVGRERLSRWVAWMGLSSVMGILLGGAAGGLGYDQIKKMTDPFVAFTGVGLLLFLVACVSAVLFKKYKNARGAYRDHSEEGVEGCEFHVIKRVRQKDLRLGALGIVSFYAIGGFILICLSQIARTENQAGAATAAGLYAGALGVGFVIGSLLVGHVQKRNPALWIAPLGAGALACGFLVLGQSEYVSEALMCAVLGAVGLSGAALVIPMQSQLQISTTDAERGPVLSVVNALTNISSLSLLALHTIANVCELSYRKQISLAGYLMLIIALYFWIRLSKELLIFFVRFCAKCIYRVRPSNVGEIPEKGGVLLVANHLSWVDAVFVYLACPRKVRFMGSARLLKNPFLRWVFEMFEVIPVSPESARSAIKAAHASLSAGDCVCIFPEGGISQTGMMLSIKKGAVLIARKAEVPVVPVLIDRVWGSVFSYSDNRFFRKIPQSFPYSVDISFGHPIPFASVGADRLRDAFLKKSEKSMKNRIHTSNHIAAVAVKNLKQGKGPTVIDRTAGRKELSSKDILGVADVLRRKIAGITEKQRVGIVLPMSGVAMGINLGAVLAGKSPVFLNTMPGKDVWESYVQTAQLDVVITAKKLSRKVQEKLPAGVRLVILEDWLKLTTWARLITWMRVSLSPVSLLCKGIRGDEVTVLFTSGSSGMPKGVRLTSSNILGNCNQVNACAALYRDDRILANLPPFHSFGYTMGCWMPLISGNTLITTPNPLDSKSSTEAIREESATLLLATPTFLRPYLRKSDPADLKSLRAVIAGAERLPHTLQAAWEDRFDSEILLGYGMTEASPVIALNVPNPEVRADKSDTWREGKRQGSSGRLLPGIRARLRDPETGAYQYGTGRGVLEVQGVNVSPGYIDNPEADHERFRDGWLNTGDIVRIDEDGFLFIEGRVSRFAKIGGEMVPLDSVEQALEAGLDRLGISLEGAVCAVPDEQKGERLILFSENALNNEEIRLALTARDAPNLWIPKQIEILETLPKLESGKINYAALNKVAMECAKQVA